MKTAIKNVYAMLQSREIHPSGKFGVGNRWYATNGDLISVRRPSRSWPFSQMKACRTLKYVKAVCVKFDCQTETDLLKKV